MASKSVRWRTVSVCEVSNIYAFSIIRAIICGPLVDHFSYESGDGFGYDHTTRIAARVSKLGSSGAPLKPGIFRVSNLLSKARALSLCYREHTVQKKRARSPEETQLLLARNCCATDKCGYLVPIKQEHFWCFQTSCEKHRSSSGKHNLLKIQKNNNIQTHITSMVLVNYFMVNIIYKWTMKCLVILFKSKLCSLNLSMMLLDWIFNLFHVFL